MNVFSKLAEPIRLSSPIVLGQSRIPKRTYGTRESRKHALLNHDEIEMARKYVCSCKVPCSSRIEYGVVSQLRRDLLDFKEPLQECKWREKIILDMLNSPDKRFISLNDLQICKSSWCQIVGGPNYYRTFDKHLNRLVANAKHKRTRPTALNDAERKELEDELRDESPLYSKMLNWVQNYFLSMSCTDPATGQAQVDDTNGAAFF